MIRGKYLTPMLVVIGLLVAGGIITEYFDYPNSVQAQNQRQAAGPADRPIQSLRDLGNAFVEIADEVRPSVVTVFSERVLRMRNPFYNSPFGGFFDQFFGTPGRQAPEQEYRQTGLGSGVIISEDGYIVTNNHVVQDADTIYVQTSDGQRQTAKVIGTDPRTDIAVLRIDANGLRAIRLGNSDDIRVGEWVVAVGSPLSPNLAQTVTQGIVSAKGRSNVGLADYEDFIQTDAAINPGNSGGPLVNLDGELIGINTAIASQSGGYQGIGFAVPVNMVKYVMESLIQEGHVVRGWLGVSISDISPAMSRTLGLESTQGALVQEVVKGSPAEDAGLKEGDVILAIDGQTVQNSTELRNRIAEIRPGTRASLTVFHEGAKNQVWVKLVEMTAEAAAAGGPGSSLDETLGFQVAELTRDLAREYGVEGGAGGAVVIAVDSESSAYQAGLREGDVVRAVNRRQVRSVDELRSLLSGVGKGDDVLLRVQRQDRYFFIAFTL